MNIFFVMDDTVITPPVEGTILPGVTRDSALTLLRDMGFRVAERRISINEVTQALGTGRLSECFGTAAAANVSSVGRICYRDADLRLPPIREDGVASLLRDRLNGIACGKLPDVHGWLDVLPESTGSA